MLKRCLPLLFPLIMVGCKTTAPQTDSMTLDSSNGSTVNGIEDQRKYGFAGSFANVLTDLKQGFDGGGIQTFFHDEYVYDDIYIDTDDVDLYHKGYSLRIRRRDKGTGSFQYVMQLKSEKSDNSQNRMEIDFEEFDGINVDIQGEPKKKLTKYIDDVFELMEAADANGVDLSKKKFQNAKTAIGKWLNDDDHNGGAKTKVMKEFRKVFSNGVMQKLEPALVGRSKRSRFHVYVNRGRPGLPPILAQIPDSLTPAANLPPFFVQNGPNFVWVGEASGDESTFYSLKNSSQQAGTLSATIAQLEVENKYRPIDDGKQYLDIYEKALQQKLNARIELDSKFHVAAHATIPKATP